MTFFWSKTFEAYDFVFPADEWLANRTCRDFIMFSIGGNWVTFQHVVWFLKFYHVLGGSGWRTPSEKFSVFLGVFIDFTFFFRGIWGRSPQKNFQVVFQTDWFFLSDFSPGGVSNFQNEWLFSRRGGANSQKKVRDVIHLSSLKHKGIYKGIREFKFSKGNVHTWSPRNKDGG